MHPEPDYGAPPMDWARLRRRPDMVLAVHPPARGGPLHSEPELVLALTWKGGGGDPALARWSWPLIRVGGNEIEGSGLHPGRRRRHFQQKQQKKHDVLRKSTAPGAELNCTATVADCTDVVAGLQGRLPGGRDEPAARTASHLGRSSVPTAVCQCKRRKGSSSERLLHRRVGAEEDGPDWCQGGRRTGFTRGGGSIQIVDGWRIRAWGVESTHGEGGSRS